jgi:hypothetical protein
MSSAGRNAGSKLILPAAHSPEALTPSHPVHGSAGPGFRLTAAILLASRWSRESEGTGIIQKEGGRKEEGTGDRQEDLRESRWSKIAVRRSQSRRFRLLRDAMRWDG